jgi:hypothetical protein
MNQGQSCLLLLLPLSCLLLHQLVAKEQEMYYRLRQRPRLRKSSCSNRLECSISSRQQQR